MQGATREQIMNALLARLQAKCGAAFLTYSREFIMWEDMIQLIGANVAKAPAFPALYLYDGVGFGGGVDNFVQGQWGTPVKQTLYRTIVFYCRKAGAGTPAGPQTQAGASVINPLIETVMTAFAPDGPDGRLTLSGLVANCWMEGDGHLIPGDIDPTGLCMQTLPVRIMIP